MDIKTDDLQPMISRVGGKTKIAREIIDLFPDHKTYAEVFIGGGSIYFRKPLVDVNVINDKDKDIIDIYRDMRDVGMETKKMTFKGSRHAFDKLKDQKKFKSKRERLFRNIYLSKFSYSGNRQSYWGEQESERKKGQKHGEVIKRNAERLIAKLKKTHILNMDFRNVIQRYDSPTTLFYLDPPYSQKISRWGYNVPHVSPEDVYNAVKNIKGKFILSYDNSPEIRKVFKSFFIKKIKTTYELSGTRQQDVTELLISNFKLK